MFEVPWQYRQCQNCVKLLATFQRAIAIFSLILLINSIYLFVVFDASAQERLALLIGNAKYNDKVGRLTNPPHDIEVVGDALVKLKFTVIRVPDAKYKDMTVAINQHIQKVQLAGADVISFIYYSGHGAADATTKTNYLIPTDVPTAEDSSLWANSMDLQTEIIDRLATRARTATHYVVLDACRNELQLKIQGKKTLYVGDKAFVPLMNPNVSNILIAYSTAPNTTASDLGEGSGPYARALAEELLKPGIEAGVMFRLVQLRVKESTGQEPWLTIPALNAIYLTQLPETKKVQNITTHVPPLDYTTISSSGDKPPFQSPCKEITVTETNNAITTWKKKCL